MRSSIRASILIFVMSVASQAQTPNQRHFQGYVFVGGGSITPGDVYTFWRGPTVTAGAGAEYVKANGLGISGEVEGILRKTYYGERHASALPSINLSYHFRNGEAARKLVPFMTGGFTAFPGVNVGGGVQYWLSPRFALRTEIRNHSLLGGDAILQAYEFRIGLAFR
jgi:hypothetical protein